MNRWTGLGRLTKDIELRYSQSNKAFCSFSLAVARRFKQDNQPDCDFISCKAFGKTAEFMGKYMSKGQQIAIEGRIQTGSYEKKDGTRVYTTDVMVNEVNFADSKKEESQQQQQPYDYSGGMTDTEMAELPF